MGRAVVRAARVVAWGVRRAVRWAADRWTALLDRWTPGLTTLGCSFWGVSTPWPWPESRSWAETWPWPESGSWTALADRPPPGHPERLCAHVPPTEVERELWSRLDLRA